MSKPLTLTAALVLTVSFPIFAEDAKPAPKPAAPAAKETAVTEKKAEPAHIVVQHILIGFAGSVPGKGITRSKDEAKKLADEILDRAKKGEDFDALVKKYTDDAYPGKYGMSNNGVAPDKSKHEYARSGMVPAFGNVGFPLEVGGVGLAEYDPRNSPYGWHIVKRVE